MAIEDLIITSRRYGLQVGAPDLEAIGPIAAGPDGVLFLADNRSATVFAVAFDERPSDLLAPPPEVDRLDSRLAALLGCSRADVHVQDMTVARKGGTTYLSVMRGGGDASRPVLIRVRQAGDLDEVELAHVPFASVGIGDAPAPDDPREDVRVVPPGEIAHEEREYNGIHLRLAKQGLRTATVTDLAYVDGSLLVAGASNEEFSSTLRRIPFPFLGGSTSTSLEIYHVSHGRYETAAPIRTFAQPDELSILASYTCTPLVWFSLAELEGVTVAKGRTVADLGSMNTPLDLVCFRREGGDYLLVSNSRLPLLKFDCRDLERQDPLTTPKEPVGPRRDELPHKGVTRMANWNGSHVLMLQRDEAGNLNLGPFSTSSL